MFIQDLMVVRAGPVAGATPKRLLSLATTPDMPTSPALAERDTFPVWVRTVRGPCRRANVARSPGPQNAKAYCVALCGLRRVASAAAASARAALPDALAASDRIHQVSAV